MTTRFTHFTQFTRSTSHPHRLALCSLAALSLGACNGRLDVTDENIGGAAGSSNPGGSGGSSGSAGSAGSAGSSGAGGSAACDDGVRNGDEAGVDCGGTSCPGCASGNPCTNGLVECDSYVCSDGVCQPPTCQDGVRNGDEAGLDCGGTSCSPCLTLCQEQCAVSDTLIPLGCDPSAPAPIGVASVPRSNEDGTRIAFDYCYDDSRCTPMYWSASEGARAFAVSGGGTLLGMSEDGQLVLVKPQVELGAESLVFAPDGSSVPAGIGAASALVSADGSLIGVSPPTTDAFSLLRRPRGGEIEPLGDLPFGVNEFTFTGVSGDASVIVGYSYAGNVSQSFRYSEGEGLVFGLEGLPETADSATIHALSRDGQVLAGVTLLGNERQNLFRWTQADGVIELGRIPPLTPGVDPGSMGLSDDGSVFVYSRETNAETGDFGAYRWSTTDGAEPLTPGIQSIASLVSGDGRVIIGQTFDDSDYRSFIWTEAGGPRSIRSALETAGVDLRGWSFDRPWSLSHDGKVAMGVGRCGELTTVYRLVLPE